MRARAVLSLLLLAVLGAALAGCGGSARQPAASGSTLLTTWGDPRGTGVLQVQPGEPPIARTVLAPAAHAGATLATLAQITDAHVVDEESPARVPFLDRLGVPFNSTFRPQESLTTQVLAGAVRAIDALHPQAVIDSGDLIDDDQQNELEMALAVLNGSRVDPNSGTPGYTGVQSADDADPLYYRPDVDAPLHPGLLAAAERPFTSPGLNAPWYPVVGNHDVLVAGDLASTPVTRAIAVGDRAVYELPPALRAPPRGRLTPAIVDPLLLAGLRTSAVHVPADPRRRELPSAEVLARLRAASGHGGSGPLDDYSYDVGAHVRVVVLDLVRRDTGSRGLVHPGQLAWLAGQLRAAGSRWVLLATHETLASTDGGADVTALLDRDPRVLAAIHGDTHTNSLTARRTPAGGYWTIGTSSLTDYPQQGRALRIVATAGGGVAIETWMLDHAPDRLGDISRQLSYLDAQGGRPERLTGAPQDRNAILYKGAP